MVTNMNNNIKIKCERGVQRMTRQQIHCVTLLLCYHGVCHHARPVVFQQPRYPTVY